MKTAILLVGYFALCAAKLVSAQQMTPWGPAALPGPYAPYPAYNHVECYHHDSTIQGNYYRGLGLMFEGLGVGLYYGGHGLIAGEHARSLWLDNRERMLWPRVERRLRLEAKVQEAKARRRWARDHQSIQPVFDPLAPLEQWLNPETGELHWPEVLIEVPDQAAAQTVESLVRCWTTQGLSLSSHDRAALKQSIRKLQAELAERIRQIEVAEYTEARRLLDRLVLAACSDRPQVAIWSHYPVRPTESTIRP
ncbi:MAG: hypothetical protein K2Y37_25365 [Pirellulales bacterium]|nr:hypothetical protein [Pirellulales bacterium]